MTSFIVIKMPENIYFAEHKATFAAEIRTVAIQNQLC